eukprot:Hpha_TRINITY_DN27788_c0_g1::TRINITY_DN27788_c0_g1_i1::g.157097::m.157097
MLFDSCCPTSEGRVRAPVLAALAFLVVFLSPAAAVSSGSSNPTEGVVWDHVELTFSADPGSAPFDVDFFTTFTGPSGAASVRVRGFYDGGEDWRVRFMPSLAGNWSWETESSYAPLEGRKGSLTVAAQAAGMYGKSPVRVRNTRALMHADGSSHVSVGTTSYAWIHQNDTVIRNTVSTLGLTTTPFNKMRMTVFPKWYEYNRGEPEFFPYEGHPNASWDFTRFNISFWQRLDQRVQALRDLSEDVQADIILFHPYDGGHWGFDCMGGSDAAAYNTSHDQRYLRYVVARLGAFRNVWWSMANEWDLVKCKSKGLPDASPVWDTLFKTLAHEDPYGHLTSIHNCVHLYNHSHPWITHISSQGGYDMAHIKRRYAPKPIIWDEVMYEGDIGHWGGLTAGQMVDRFWWGLSYGIYVGHGETVLYKNISDDNQVLWWSKGNILRGDSPPRILWFQNLVRPHFDSLSCSCTGWGGTLCDDSCLGGYTLGDGMNMVTDEATIYYIHSSAYNVPSHPPTNSSLTLPPGIWALHPIDFFGMRVLPATATFTGGAAPVSLTGDMMTFPELTNVNTTAPCNRSSASCCDTDPRACTPYTAMLVRFAQA